MFLYLCPDQPPRKAFQIITEFPLFSKAKRLGRESSRTNTRKSNRLPVKGKDFTDNTLATSVKNFKFKLDDTAFGC